MNDFGALYLIESIVSATAPPVAAEVADMVGETSEGLTAMMPEYLIHKAWDAVLTKWEDEDRKYNFID